VPTQIVSNGEFNPLPQTHQPQQVEGRIKELVDKHAVELGMDRRHFLRTSCGMAAAFVAMNHVFGNLFDVSEAEGGDALHEAFTFQWPRQFDEIPLGEGTAPPIR
jgi:uncharacterized protein